MSLDRRIGRLEQGSYLGGEDDDLFFMRVEQSHPQLSGSPEIAVEHYFLDPAQPELGSFERHRQYGAIVYDGLDELLATVKGNTRSL